MAKFREFDMGGRSPWKIIFTDMMTLLLTFFIILVSMSAVDERSRVRAVESVQKVFGIANARFNFNELHNVDGLSSGAQSTRPEDRLQESRQLIFADNQNMTLRHSESELILEVSSDMLFAPGSASISEVGRVALDRLVPMLINARFPIIIAGHGAPGYSEGVGTSLSYERLADNSWALSMDRALAVYRHFIMRGVDKNTLRLESFGSHRPEYDNATAEGRRKNRRVDIVLDGREAVAGTLGRQSNDAGSSGYIFRDFHFDLDITPPQGAGQGGGN